MLKVDNNDGMYYVSDKTGIIYDLEMGMSIGVSPKRTSDKCFIVSREMTEEEYKQWLNGDYTKELNERIVGWFYGATFLTDDEYKEEYVKIIKDYVDEYESKKIYSFTKKGVADFYIDSINNALDLIERKGRAIDIDIKVGKMHITIPDTADNYERLGAFLRECQEDTVPIEDVRKEDKIMENKVEVNQSIKYKTKDCIDASCYSSVFLSVMEVMHKPNEEVDGWYAMEFLHWLKRTAEEFQDYITENSDSYDLYKDIYFATYGEYEDSIREIVYGTSLKDCLIKQGNYVTYYKIHLTEDAELLEITLVTKTMEERILSTLEDTLLINREFMEEADVKDLEEQIEYMKQKIKEGD